MDVVLEHEHYSWQRGKDQGRAATLSVGFLHF